MQESWTTLEEVGQEVQRIRPDLRPGVIDQAIKEIRAKSFDDSPDVQRIILETSPYLNLNPRKIKRFVNLFRLQALIANRRGLLNTVIQLPLLAKWIVIVTRWPSLVEAITIDEHFVLRLMEARKMLEDSKQKRLPQRDYQRRMDPYLENPYIKRLIGATDLMNLLKQITDSEIEMLPCYLYLTQTTVETFGKASAPT